MFSYTLKVMSSLKGKPIFNHAHGASKNGMKIATIGKESVPVLIMDISPANALIQQKFASSEHLVRAVSTLKGLYTSSELIHFMIQQIHVDNNY